MPKRILDGEGLWRSDKLASIQPPALRAEYANLLPLALANGTFECNPRLVWSTVYTYNRPDMTEQDVVQLLDELVRVKILFRFVAADGKEWGYWVGINRKGRLPPPSRMEQKLDKVGAPVPQDQLANFLGIEGAAAEVTASGQLAASYIGTGSGKGTGDGIGEGIGVGTSNESETEPTTLSVTNNKNIEKNTNTGKPVTDETNKPQPDDVLRSRVAALLKRYPRDPKTGEALTWEDTFIQGITDLAAAEYNGDLLAATDRAEYCVDRLISYVMREKKDRKYTYAPERFFRDWVPATDVPDEKARPFKGRKQPGRPKPKARAVAPNAPIDPQKMGDREYQLAKLRAKLE